MLDFVFVKENVINFLVGEYFNLLKRVYIILLVVQFRLPGHQIFFEDGKVTSENQFYLF